MGGRQTETSTSVDILEIELVRILDQCSSSSLVHSEHIACFRHAIVGDSTAEIRIFSRLFLVAHLNALIARNRC